MIEVNKIDDTTFEVHVEDVVKTTHEVTVDRSFHEHLTHGRVPVETLLERSFEFLLTREPNTAILKSFNLSSISRYFPEYETEIRKALA